MIRRIHAFLAIMLIGCALAVGGEADEWLFPAKTPLRFHIVRGIWARNYRPYEGIAAGGGGLLSESYTGMGFASNGFLQPRGKLHGGWVSGYPQSAKALSRSHVLIVINTPGDVLANKKFPALAEYVKAGGSVFFLGGRFALGKPYREAPFAAMCPVEFPGEGLWGSDLEKEPAADVIGPGPAAAEFGLNGLDFKAKPVVFYSHAVTPKAEAKVLLTAGEKPLLVCGSFGRGRVAVFAGTVLGEPEERQLPFWDWDGWPMAFGKVVEWLGKTDPVSHDAALKKMLSSIREASEVSAGGDALMELEGEAPAKSGGAGKSDEKTAALLKQVTESCQDKATVQALIQTLAVLQTDIPRDVALQMQYELWPYFDASLREAGKTLVASGDPNRTAVGLVVLGASKDPAVLETLVRFYTEGKVPEKKQSGDVMSLMNRKATGPVDTAKQIAEDLRLAALQGIVSLQHESALPFLKTCIEKLAPKGRYSTATKGNDTFRDYFEMRHMLYQEALLAAAFCGDTAAGEALPVEMMNNQYVVLRAKIEGNKTEELIEKARSYLPAEYAFMTYQTHRFTRAPDAAILPLAKGISTIEDWRVARIAMPLFAGKTLPDAVKTALKSSPVESVQRMGR